MHLSQALIGPAENVIRLGRICLQLNGSTNCLDGFGIVLLFQVGLTELYMSLRVVGFQLDGSPQLLNGRLLIVTWLNKSPR